MKTYELKLTSGQLLVLRDLAYDNKHNNDIRQILEQINKTLLNSLKGDEK